MNEELVSWTRQQIKLDMEQVQRQEEYNGGADLKLDSFVAAGAEYCSMDIEPSRMRAELAAKLALLDEWENALVRQAANTALYARQMRDPMGHAESLTGTKTYGWELQGQRVALAYAVQIIAQPYADREGWRPEWTLTRKDEG